MRMPSSKNRRFSVFCALAFFFLISFFAWSQDVENALVHYRLGETYYEHGLHEEAEEEFQKALELLQSPEQQVGQEPVVAAVAPAQAEYLIGEGDELVISVWENEDLNQEAIVRPDGKISFPLIDEVQAQGKSISTLDKEITESLKAYLRFPDVSISLKKMGGSKIVLLGEVRQPGVYAVTGRVHLLEAIALAGGFSADSVASSVIVIKGGLSNPSAQRINLTEALHKPESKQNLLLEAEDIVFVPKKFIANVNYALKQILEPLSRGMATKSGFDNF